MGMFLLLEPYAAGAALCELHADLRAPADEEEDADLEPERANVVAWMGAVATRTKSLLLAAVEALPALSAAGAKQLAADVGYLSNIFAAGLSLPHAELTELEGLLRACAEDVRREISAHRSGERAGGAGRQET